MFRLRQRQVEAETGGKPVANEAFGVKMRSQNTESIFLFTFRRCLILCIFSFQTLVFSHRQHPFHLSLLHADRFTLRHALLLFLNASAVLCMKREITWLWREIVPACMVYFTASLFLIQFLLT